MDQRGEEWEAEGVNYEVLAEVLGRDDGDYNISTNSPRDTGHRFICVGFYLPLLTHSPSLMVKN